MKTFLVLLFISAISFSGCQSADWISVSGGQLTTFSSLYAPFPHPERTDGHVYQDSLYTFEAHYNDSTVAVFVPDNFVQTDAIDLVFYFHGWGNNIQKSLDEFQLLEQFSASHKNAIFVFPEGPKDAPDSFGGKLEDTDVFGKLVEDVLSFLSHENKISTTIPGRIVLAGHSGAYHVISSILNRGGLTSNISEVYLFDALYGQSEKFLHWLETYQGRFINIVTPNGGTYDNSLDFLENLTDWGKPFQKYTQNELSLEEFGKAEIISVFTNLTHSEVINPYFELLLKTSHLKNIP